MAGYQIATAADRRQLSDFLISHGQFLLPMVKLIEQSQAAIEEVIDVTGRATIEAILEASALELAGAKSPGKASGEIRWHGIQEGVTYLSDRKLRVRRPRLRHKTDGEIELPAQAALKRSGRLADRMMSILLDGVSTRKYKRVIPEMAQTLGVSKSAVSRANVQAGEKLLAELAGRRFDSLDILIVYLDGLRLGEHHILGAVGVDSSGQKHVLGLRQGSSENTTMVTELLNDLVSRGLDPARRRLFVIDGSKALRAGIDAVFGKDHPVQRCRTHKLRNVLDHLPKDQHANAKSTLRAAWKLPPEQGKRQIEQLAKWYEKKHPSASSSLLEGLDELFTINDMGLPPKLQRCLATTNVIESTHGGARQRIGRVKNWQDGAMALRWASVAFEATAGNFRRIMGHQQLWMLKAHLEQSSEQEQVDEQKKVG